MPPLNSVAARDAELADAIAAGDRSAFSQLFEQHGGAVRGVAAKVLRDKALAEDVAQETFVAFWDEPSRFDAGRGSLRTFLVTIAHRKAVDMVRSEVARSRREERPPDRVHAGVEDEVWSRTLSATVRSALETLSDGEREAIVNAYYGGLSYVQVAEKLGLPEGTVKSRIRAGMRKLAVALKDLDA